MEDIPVAYQLIPEPKPISTGAPPTAPPPASMYAEINDPEIEMIRKRSMDNSASKPPADSAHQTRPRTDSGPRSSPVDWQSNGSLSPHDVLTQSDIEQMDNAMYAQIDYEKKREGRRKREQQERQKASQVTESIDSWV